MTSQFSYADAGVDRKLRAESKKHLRVLKKTYGFSHYGNVVELPYGNIFPYTKGRYLDLVVEGVGTKVLVSQLAEKYDTIGVDGVAVAVNDVIRSGARPMAVVDNIHAHVSDPALVSELMNGITRGACEAQCIVPGGEIGDVAELIRGVAKGKGFDLVVAAIGEVSDDQMITGREITVDDRIIGLRSSGIHSNGISLARKILFKRWGGKYDAHDIPAGHDREIIYEVLEPTKIYAEPVLEVAKEAKLKAAIHVTGDAYAKLNTLTRFSPQIGFEISDIRPQPIFEIIRQTAVDMARRITYEEMFRTFNMGWGFMIIVDKADRDRALDALGRTRTQAGEIGRVKRIEGVRILYKGREIHLK